MGWLQIWMWIVTTIVFIMGLLLAYKIIPRNKFIGLKYPGIDSLSDKEWYKINSWVGIALIALSVPMALFSNFINKFIAL